MLYPCYISAVTVLYLYRKHQLDYLIIKVDFTFFSYNSLSLIEMNHAKGFARERGEKPNFDDRFDLRARFSANIADVFGIEKQVDIYPGLNIGIKNFGAHLGARYFITDGFGLYSEIQFPIAHYDNNPVGFEKYNNQFNFSIGASFNL